MVVSSQQSPAGQTPKKEATHGRTPDLVRGDLARTPAAFLVPMNRHHSIMFKGVDKRSLCRMEAWMHSLNLPAVTLSTSPDNR